MEQLTTLRNANLAVPATEGAAIPASSRTYLLVMARAAWIAWTLILAGAFALSVPLRYDEVIASPFVQSSVAELGITPGLYASYTIGLEMLFAFVFMGAGVLIFTRKRGDWMSLYVSFTLVTVSVGGAPLLHVMSALTRKYTEWDIPVTVLALLSWSLLHVFTYIFPDGRFIPRWTYAAALVTVGLMVPWFLLPVDSPFSPWSWHPALIVMLVLAIGSTPAVTQIYRYRRHTNEQYRQQIKWVVYGLAIASVGGTAAFLPLALPAFKPVVTGATLGMRASGDPTLLVYQLLGTTIFCLAGMVLPAAIGVSILKYRLWAIDLIISRTLVYVPLTGILGGAYAASIALFQKVFVAFTGDRSDAAIVISTLVLASLFTPVKNALQFRVDRHYSESNDPARRLAELSHKIQAVTSVRNPRSVARRTVLEAAKAFNAEGAAIYLEHNGRLQLADSTEGWNDDGVICVPLRYGETKLGLLALGPRKGGTTYTAGDRTILQSVADRVAELISLETVKGIL